MNGSSAQTGKAGERMTVEWLRTQGFYICECNWRAGRYEIDIIAMRWDTVHFVEVKTRRSGGWVSPHTAVDASKIRALRRAASAYLAMHRMSRYHIQFDLAAVETFPDGHADLQYTENII